VVSLCPVGPEDAPPGVELSRFGWSISPIRERTRTLASSCTNADLLQALRAEGRTVLLHSVRAKSRVPVVACAYGLRLHTVPTTLVIAEVESVLFGRE